MDGREFKKNTDVKWLRNILYLLSRVNNDRAASDIVGGVRYAVVVHTRCVQLNCCHADVGYHSSSLFG